MAAYQIVRIECHPCPVNPATLHVVAVATGNPTLYDRVWTAEEVMAAAEQGDQFRTQSAKGEWSEAVTCDRCVNAGRHRFCYTDSTDRRIFSRRIGNGWEGAKQKTDRSRNLAGGLEN